MYTASMALVGFLALQVWGLNGKMERITAQNEARQLMDTERAKNQQVFNQRIEHLIERLENKVDGLAADANGDGKGD